MAVKYLELNASAKLAIWRSSTLLSVLSGAQTPEGSSPSMAKNHDASDLEALPQKQFNGRTIKNLVRTAQALTLSASVLLRVCFSVTHGMTVGIRGPFKVVVRAQEKTNTTSSHPVAEAEEGQDDNRKVVVLLGITIAAINTTKDLVPIELAKGILGTIANILTIAQSVIKNKSDFLEIVQKCETIRGVLERVSEGATKDDLQGSSEVALSKLNKAVNRVNSEVSSKKEQTILGRLFFATIDRDRIASWGKELDYAISLFEFEAIADVRIEMKKLTSELKGNANGSNILRHCQVPVPPSRPSMFYGRDDLVTELTNLVVNDKHIALIGAGGMGKSSLAKAILNEALVVEKFAEQRFFVTYDGMDPSAITFETFMARFARDLGIELAGADPMRQIC
ncbi:hypothetical protein M405DRAFT_935977, partial [Rhizopogon salebrosus TDB-379]